MRAERERIAKRYRAEGDERAREIRAGADREREVILATAYETSQKLSGEGDAQATTIYAQAFGQSQSSMRLLGGCRRMRRSLALARPWCYRRTRSCSAISRIRRDNSDGRVSYAFCRWLFSSGCLSPACGDSFFSCPCLVQTKNRIRNKKGCFSFRTRSVVDSCLSMMPCTSLFRGKGSTFAVRNVETFTPAREQEGEQIRSKVFAPRTSAKE